jgi:hypothetical protein
MEDLRTITIRLSNMIFIPLSHCTIAGKPQIDFFCLLLSSQKVVNRYGKNKCKRHGSNRNSDD